LGLARGGLAKLGSNKVDGNRVYQIASGDSGVGGMVPLGYDSKERRLGLMRRDRRLQGRSPDPLIRTLKTGATVGGIPFTRGPLRRTGSIGTCGRPCDCIRHHALSVTEISRFSRNTPEWAGLF
jgi:hypothetical protein